MDAEGECRLLYAPVSDIGSGVLTLRTGRLPSGQRVGLAFSSTALLLAALGPGQRWIRLHEDAMHDMLGPAGIHQIRVDACIGAPAGAAEVTESGRTPPYRCASLTRVPRRPRRTKHDPLGCSPNGRYGASKDYWVSPHHKLLR